MSHAEHDTSPSKGRHQQLPNGDARTLSTQQREAIATFVAEVGGVENARLVLEHLAKAQRAA